MRDTTEHHGQETARHHYAENLAAEFNHYEGAAAMSHNLPTLILAETGVSNRGITYRGGGKNIISIPSRATAAWLRKPAFTKNFAAWKKQIRKRNDVFFGYCSKAGPVVKAIKKFLEKKLGLSVQDWAVDFKAGGSILTRIAEAAEGCETGLFLFTNDDGPAGKGKKAAPRDNVIFEAGFFMHAKGSERVVIIREKGAKMPADLGGNIYLALKDRTDIAPLHEPLRTFFAKAL